MRCRLRVRRVGGAKGRRPALGVTIPTVIAKDLSLEIGDDVDVFLSKVPKKNPTIKAIAR